MRENDLFEYGKDVAIRSDERNIRPKRPQREISKISENIRKIYELVSIFLELNINIHPANEWLVDNFYIIEKESINIEEKLSSKKISNRELDKMYFLAMEYLKYVEGKIEVETLREFLKGYIQIRYISLKELEFLPVALKFVDVMLIAELLNKTIYVDKQKYKVEKLVRKYIKNEINTLLEYRFPKVNNYSINTAFIEYMAYRLKDLETDKLEYLAVFDDEVKKLGITTEEAISIQHFDTITKQELMSKYILSLKNVSNINFEFEFKNISEIDQILLKEKANIYSQMNFETVKMYREKICEISKKHNITEKYLCMKIVELCNRHDGIKAHSGYYLLGEGRNELYDELGIFHFNRKKNTFAMYLSLFFALTYYITIMLAYGISHKCIVTAIVIILPVSQIVISILNTIYMLKTKPTILPALDFSEEVPDESRTFCIVPTIISSTKRLKELIVSLEEMYLINKQKNIYFALLGDVTEIDKQKIELDDEIVQFGKSEIQKLNDKYGFAVPKFYFMYRKRRYNEKQEKYLGWERKRGLIIQFNRFLIYGENSDFILNQIDREKIGQIKYVLTLDGDTKVGINNISKLAGKMAHPLNTPVLNKEKSRVLSGYGIMQPRIGVDIDCSTRNIFSNLWTDKGGIDIYTRAISDIYQDNWGEGIFTGKGIYDLNVFSQILDNQIPENMVLSHDLLEGSYLRCGLATDVECIDGFPTRYNSYIVRQNRWLRGDIQILSWTLNTLTFFGKRQKNPLNILSKWKILDNIRRGLLNLALFRLVFIGSSYLHIKWYVIMLIYFLTYHMVDILNVCIQNRVIVSNKNSRECGIVEKNIYKSFLGLIFLPYEAITNFKTICITVYRMFFSKKKLLEWLTAEQAEKMLGKDLETYFKQMYTSILWGIALVGLTWYFMKPNYIFSIVIGIMWASAPFVAWYISKEKKVITEISENDEKYLKKIGEKTWQYFRDGISERYNFLVADNYQENRKSVFAKRTSPTNIGLSLIAIISAYDLKYINGNEAKKHIVNIVETIKRLKKYRGNLYNWYNIDTLKNLNDDISSVDNGNLIAYLYVVKEFCNEQNYEKKIIDDIDEIINQMDLSILYNNEKGLFSIEYNVRTGKLSESYYDLLASEARILSYVAISKGDVPYKHWYNLSRSLTSKFGKNGLISWSGTGFEYFMPYTIMKSFKNTLLDETYDLCYLCQKAYVKKKKIPWGISESAYNLYDLEYNYQYKAFGLPWLGLKRGLKDDLVIAPYASILMLPKYTKNVIDNMKNLERIGTLGKYGYYEAVDYTKNRRGKNRAIVKTFMAHHQGLILLSINNALNDKIIQKRFMRNPENHAIEMLLEEKTQNDIVIKQVGKDNIYNEKEEKNVEYEIYSEKVQKEMLKYNVIGNNGYMICVNSDGQGYSVYGDKDVYAYNSQEKHVDDINGIKIYLRKVENEKLINCMYGGNVFFSNYRNIFEKSEDGICSEISINALQKTAGEIRNIRLRNETDESQLFDLYIYFEPSLSKREDRIVHRAYSNMFLEYEENNKVICVHRRKKEINEQDFFCCANIVSNKTIDVEYDIDRMSFIGRNKILETSNVMYEQLPMKNKALNTVETCIAYKIRVNLEKDEIVNIALIVLADDNKENIMLNMKQYSDYLAIQNEMKLSENKGIIEANFYKYTNKEVQEYIKILSCILNEKVRVKYDLQEDKKLKVTSLWKYGISGDNPIVAIYVNSKIEKNNLAKLLKAYDYIKRKRVKVDYVIQILNSRYCEEIYSEVIKQIMLNQLGGEINNGIYVSKKQLEVDNVIYQLEINCKDAIIPEEKRKSIKDLKKKVKDNYGGKIDYDISKLLYYNEIGGFDKENKEYVIILNNGYSTPAPWVDIIANEQFGTMVSENGCVFTWNINSGQNKITKWNNDQVKNIPSEYIEIIEKNKSWGIYGYPERFNDATYIIRYGRGYAIYESCINDLSVKEMVFVPINDKLKIVICKIKNVRNEKRKMNIKYFLNILLGNEIDKKIYCIEEDKEKNCLKFANRYSNVINKEIAYITGYEVGNEREKMQYDMQKIEERKLAMQKTVELLPNETKKVVFVLGQENSEDKINEMICKYSDIKNVEEEYIKNIEKWKKLCDSIQIEVPIESMNCIFNDWLIYQTIVSRLYGKTGFYQCSGAYGFRDQLQDVLCLLYSNKEIAKKQILYHAQHQYVEGDVMHWWDEKNAGIRTRYSDDMLWLVYVTLEYIQITGEKDILDEKVSYVSSLLLEENEKQRYEIPNKADDDSLYNHLCKAIDKSINLAKNNLPYIGGGDWNDGLSNLYGQSVWLGFFLLDILKKFEKIVKERDKKKYLKYCNTIEALEEGLKKTWDGKWYKRAFFNTGEELGSAECEECKIDCISQAWAVMSGYNSIYRNIQAMQSADKVLVDRADKFIKLFTPSFNKTKLEPGYIKGYIAGIRENGGQYTHAAIWLMQAQAILGNGNLAEEYYRIINPIEHTRTNEAVRKYKVEPYVVSADVYSGEGLEGRGGWSWYTGSASWLYKVTLENILGLQINDTKLRINPCISSQWKEYKIKYKYMDTEYNIWVKNNNGKETGVIKILENNIENVNKTIELQNDKAIHYIIVEM